MPCRRLYRDPILAVSHDQCARTSFLLAMADVAAGTVGVNPRGGDVERGVTIDTFVERLDADVRVAAISL